jgi:hypothetical protein
MIGLKWNLVSLKEKLMKNLKRVNLEIINI